MVDVSGLIADTKFMKNKSPSPERKRAKKAVTAAAASMTPAECFAKAKEAGVELMIGRNSSGWQYVDFRPDKCASRPYFAKVPGKYLGFAIGEEAALAVALHALGLDRMRRTAADARPEVKAQWAKKNQAAEAMAAGENLVLKKSNSITGYKHVYFQSQSKARTFFTQGKHGCHSFDTAGEAALYWARAERDSVGKKRAHDDA